MSFEEFKYWEASKRKQYFRKHVEIISNISHVSEPTDGPSTTIELRYNMQGVDVTLKGQLSLTDGRPDDTNVLYLFYCVTEQVLAKQISPSE